MYVTIIANVGAAVVPWATHPTLYVPEMSASFQLELFKQNDWWPQSMLCVYCCLVTQFRHSRSTNWSCRLHLCVWCCDVDKYNCVSASNQKWGLANSCRNWNNQYFLCQRQRDVYNYSENKPALPTCLSLTETVPCRTGSQWRRLWNPTQGKFQTHWRWTQKNRFSQGLKECWLRWVD